MTPICDDESDGQVERLIIQTLRNEYGDGALAVAQTQLEQATSQTGPTWNAIVKRLTGVAGTAA